MDTRPAQNAEETDTGLTIKIVLSEGVIEESAGRRRFCIDRNGMFHEYEKRMICGSGCPYTLPMHFITIDGTEKAFYDFTGCLQLEDYIRKHSSNDLRGDNNHKPLNEALDVFSKILDGIKGMESYLLFPERFSIHPDVIFVHIDGTIAFACYRNENPELPLQERIVALIDHLIRLYRDIDTEQYLEKFKEAILLKNPGLDGMISILGMLKREINYIYWNLNNFRKEEGTANITENKSIEREQKKSEGYGELSGIRKIQLRSKKMILIQSVFTAGLAAVYMTGFFEPTDFIGLTILAAGADLWLVRKLNLI